MALKEDRRKQILSAAREEFAKGGYHATKIDDIVAAAKIARGTFYLYFTDKRSIFEELVDRFSTRLGMAILRVDPQDPSRSVEAQVRENIRRVLSVFLEDRMMAKIFVADAVGVDGAFDAKLMSFHDEVAKLFMQSLLDGQKLGLVKQGDVRLFSHFTMGGMKEVLYQIVTRHLDHGVDDLVDGIFAILRDGFLTTVALPAAAPRRDSSGRSPKVKRVRS
jgi:AcrR family transcriptional regulator